VNLLYVALKEALPGSHGGAVHVFEVAQQLTRRGHRVTVMVQRRSGEAEREPMAGFELVRLPARSNYELFRLEPDVRQFAAALEPGVVMERYYNFSGAGVRAAAQSGIPSLLEVNAPMLDPPGTLKHLADRALLGRLTRMARHQASTAQRIVTPLAATVPFPEAREKVREIPWGANVELFDRTRLDPARAAALAAILNPERKRVVAFLGSFRPWHGVREFVELALELARQRHDILFLMIGSGELLDPLRNRVKQAGLDARIVLTGGVPYVDVPYYLALADVGVAPFNPAVHPPLRIGFYWSPLKVHEYMAMALPVVTIDVPGLDKIARNEREGLLYPAGDLAALRSAVLRLVEDPELANCLGRAGRERVVEHYSWQKHAERLESVLKEINRS
jgi:glycosyltransferase involved in cell wall biosynthesis